MKRILSLFLVLLFLPSVFSVVVVEQNPNTQPAKEVGAIESFMSGISMALILGVIVLFAILGLLYAIISTLYERASKLIKAEVRRKQDLEFNIYYTFNKICKRNANRDMRRAIWWTLWLWIRRSNVFLETETEGRKFIGKYDGHSWKKEGTGWFIVALHNFQSIKNSTDEILVVPQEVAEKNVYFDNVSGKRRSLIIRCEGIDETSSTDYFLLPLIKNHENQFIDFSDKIQKELFDNYTHRKVIKEISEEYRESMREAVELNPYIQQERKAGSKLNER